MSGGRIAITGLGSVSAAGGSAEALWESAAAGMVNVSVRAVETRNVSVYAAALEPPGSTQERRLAHHADRSVLLALAAAKEAVRMARLQESGMDRQSVGLVIGSSRGPAGIGSAVERHWPKHPTDSAYTTFSSISGAISAELDIHGCAMMVSATCVSGAAALKIALQMLETGEADAVVAGGVDAPLVDSLLEQFAATRVLASKDGPGVLRPFDKARGGTLLGEGAAFLVLEREASAVERGARILGFLRHVAVIRWNSSRTGGSREGDSLRAVIEKTLCLLQWPREAVSLLHLHGTGTELNDTMESECVRGLFGPEEEQPFCWATKGVTGHTLGASALFQAVLTLQAFQHSFLPGTANCANLDPLCRIRLNTGQGVPTRLRTALCLTSGFWGNTSCMALEACAPGERVA